MRALRQGLKRNAGSKEEKRTEEQEMKKIYIEKSTGICGRTIPDGSGLLAIAVKGYKHKDLKTWKQVSEYQRRGWTITLVAR